MWIAIEMPLSISKLPPVIRLVTEDKKLVYRQFSKGYGWNIEGYDGLNKDSITKIKNDQAGRLVYVYFREVDKI